MFTKTRDYLRVLRISLFPHLMASAFVRKVRRKNLLFHSENLDEALQDACEKHLTEEELAQPDLVKKIKEDMIISHLICKASPSEYFQYDFRHKSYWERNTYVTDDIKFRTLFKTTGKEAFFEDLQDKWNFYQLQRDYFKRDVCKVESPDDWESYRSFALKHPRYFKKPNNLSLGTGCSIEETTEENLKATFEDMANGEDCWILEECIRQVPFMSNWNESSVNTLRVASYLAGGKFKFFSPIFRVGRKGAIVDNGGAKGILAGVDPETGIVHSNGYDKDGIVYERHPDSGLTFKGTQIPQWAELIELEEKVHRSMPPYHRYVAFDFALSDKGWVLIEGNWGQFGGLQTTSQRGYKYDFLKLMRS